MSERQRIGLDNPVFNGRLRQRTPQFTRTPPRGAASAGHTRGAGYPARPRIAAAPVRRPARVPVAAARQAKPALRPAAAPTALSRPPVFAVPQTQPARPVPAPRQQHSEVLKRQFVRAPGSASGLERNGGPRRWWRYSKPQQMIIGMACLVFALGLGVSLQALLTNHNASAQVAALSKQVDNQSGGSNGGSSSSLPSTTKPSSQAISNYAVAPDLPRYLDIPKLNVHARVMQVGVTTSGALGTPNNVFDTAWYTGSAKPGQPGATLIDGHVSSWTTHGVFYNIKHLVKGDNIRIVRGDGTIINYQVVKTQVYNADNVDMQAAITPVTPGKSGLNLITCTGQVKKGTSEFNERVIVFAQQV